MTGNDNVRDLCNFITNPWEFLLELLQEWKYNYSFYSKQRCLFIVIRYLLNLHFMILQLYIWSRITDEDPIFETRTWLRHGPFDILGGGGGGLGFRSGPKKNFGQYRSKVVFFAGPSGRIIFFITESYKYRGFCDNFMLNNGFRDNYVLNSGFHNKFRFLPQIHTQFRFSRQPHTARGTTRQLHSQLNALFRFSSQFHTQIALISLCEHHSHIIKNCLVMIIGHSNCEKGY